MNLHCKLLLMCVLGFAVLGCDMIEYHPYDLPVDNGRYRDLNNASINRIRENEESDDDTLRFVFMGDTQRRYDETVDFVKSVNRKANIDFVIHGGDISDFGMAKEYIWIHEIMKKLNVPYVAIIGNHDILGQGKEVYHLLYGEYNYSFIYKKTRFVLLNTCALEYDYSEPIPDYSFILRQLSDTTDYDNTIVAMHVPPFDIEFNNNTAYYFEELILKFKNPLFCVHAHNHKLLQDDYFNDGLVYYGCESMKERSYYVFTVVKGEFTCSLVRF